MLSIDAGNRLGHTALSAGWDSFANGLLEAAACIAERPDEPVILVHADDKLPQGYDAFREADDAALPLVVAIALGRPGGTSSGDVTLEPASAMVEMPPTAAWPPISFNSCCPTRRVRAPSAGGHSGSGAVLLRQLDFAWRLVGTGLGFVVFLGGGLLLAVVAFPAIDLLTPAASQRRERYHDVMRWAFRAFVGMLTGLRVIAVKIDDPGLLRGSKGVIVVANHPTLIDIVLLSAFIPRAQCIVKRELLDSPFLGRIVRGSGYIPNDLEPEALVDACRAALADSRSLIVFPEGTRSRPGVPLHFHRGFAHIATLLEADIQLALISCVPPMLGKGDKWWAIPSHLPQFRVSSAGWICAASWQSDGYRSLAARDIVRRAERLYNDRLVSG